MRKPAKGVKSKLEFEIIARQVQVNRERFIQRLSRQLAVVPNPELGSPCVLWTGYTKRNGYGAITFVLPGGGYKKGETNKYVKQFMVHRMFLILKLGRPIHPKMDCAHLCHTRNCVSHVEEQTHLQNCYARERRRAA